MRLIVIHPSTELYGADRILALCLECFPPDARITLVLPGPGPLVEHIKNRGLVQRVTLEIVEFPRLPIIARRMFTPGGMVDLLRRMCEFRSWLRARPSFDASYFNTLSTMFCLVAGLGLLGRRIIHVHEIVERPWLVARFLATAAGMFGDRVICVSEAVRSNLLVRSLLPFGTSAPVIHNGIPDLGAGHHFGPSSSDAATEQSSRVVQFVLIGRIMPEKGQWYVLDALALLGPEVRARMHVVFYGGPAPGREKLVDDLLERIGALGLSGAVELRGFTQDVAKVLRECHVALVPSLMRDPFPTTVLEAMSSGKFVITTDHGGAAEVVEHLSTGYLVPPGDARALADAFLFSLAEPTKRIAIGARARESYLSGFTFDTFKERFRGVLWPAVGAHVPGTGVKP